MSATMDMAELLADPDLGSCTIVLTRSVETVDAKGRTQQGQSASSQIAVVQPAEPEALERLPEADRSGEVIAVYSTVQLTTGSDTLAPDVVTWQGRDYRVKSVEDRLAIAGYCLALAVSVDMQGKEPTA